MPKTFFESPLAQKKAQLDTPHGDIIIFANLWGIALKEWKDTSFRTRLLIGCGLALLVGSKVVAGYGNYLKVR